MSLAAGARLGPYEVIAPIGAAGMGDVYRAGDTTLNRDVAIKMLPHVFASRRADGTLLVGGEGSPGKATIVVMLNWMNGIKP